MTKHTARGQATNMIFDLISDFSKTLESMPRLVVGVTSI